MTQGKRFFVKDKQLHCLVCGADRFTEREVLLNTSGATFMGFDAFNKAAVGAVCTSCGFVHHFIGDEHYSVD
jgi:hypothetical protein